MRVLKWLAVLLILVVGIAFIVGYRLPREHTATVEREFAHPPDVVYQAIATPAQYPRWRTGVQRVDVLPDSAGVRRFREITLSDEILYEVEDAVPGQLYVTRIAQPDLPYGGSWTFELERTPRGTLLRITEDGEVYNAFFRFVGKYVLGHTRSLEQYLDDLDKRLTSGMSEAGG